MVQNVRKTGYFLALAAALAAVLFFGAGKVQAASKLALFRFEHANDMKMEKGTAVDLAGEAEASSWTSSNPKVVKVSKKGIATAVKNGKAVISAKIDGVKAECQITVVKDAAKGSHYIKNVYRTWRNLDSGKKVTIKSGSFKDGLSRFVSLAEPQNADDVVYKKCRSITAIEEDSAGATVYFDAVGIFHGKEVCYPCAAVFTNDYEHEAYDYAMILQPVTWVMDDGLLLYGTGFSWYA